MGLFHAMLLLGTKPRNPLETSLMAFLKEEMSPARFEVELGKSHVVILLKEPPGDAQSANRGLSPLMVDGADGRPALCVFTHRDRSLAMVKSAPDYGCALETEFAWVLSITPPGIGMVFNPGTVFSTEVAPEGVDAMRA